ncbi:hypothetical protein BOTBODRAFT_171726 [Botryobasidium botryosum FD-172 SS1]|uniref:Uncharacterized protein n=1 Tax=Botryobasidium botryosum (strain FD-172 SS1) TaxID=930990 RepID=A0A067N2N6_BOTB1|nr:hypothetical protein BOTBODRAFT_171726 [Botryobasidium botryosum FD-172 SS1]
MADRHPAIHISCTQESKPKSVTNPELHAQSESRSNAITIHRGFSREHRPRNFAEFGKPSEAAAPPEVAHKGWKIDLLRPATPVFPTYDKLKASSMKRSDLAPAIPLTAAPGSGSKSEDCFLPPRATIATAVKDYPPYLPLLRTTDTPSHGPSDTRHREVRRPGPFPPRPSTVETSAAANTRPYLPLARTSSTLIDTIARSRQVAALARRPSSAKDNASRRLTTSRPQSGNAGSIQPKLKPTPNPELQRTPQRQNRRRSRSLDSNLPASSSTATPKSRDTDKLLNLRRQNDRLEGLAPSQMPTAETEPEVDDGTHGQSDKEAHSPATHIAPAKENPTRNPAKAFEALVAVAVYEWRLLQLADAKEEVENSEDCYEKLKDRHEQLKTAYEELEQRLEDSEQRRAAMEAELRDLRVIARRKELSASKIAAG